MCGYGDESEMKQIAILFLRVIMCCGKVALVTNVRASLNGNEMVTGV